MQTKFKFKLYWGEKYVLKTTQTDEYDNPNRTAMKLLIIILSSAVYKLIYVIQRTPQLILLNLFLIINLNLSIDVILIQEPYAISRPTRVLWTFREVRDYFDPLAAPHSIFCLDANAKSPACQYGAPSETTEQFLFFCPDIDRFWTQCIRVKKQGSLDCEKYR